MEELKHDKCPVSSSQWLYIVHIQVLQTFGSDYNVDGNDATFDSSSGVIEYRMVSIITSCSNLSGLDEAASPFGSFIFYFLPLREFVFERLWSIPVSSCGLVRIDGPTSVYLATLIDALTFGSSASFSYIVDGDNLIFLIDIGSHWNRLLFLKTCTEFVTVVHLSYTTQNTSRNPN